MSGGVAGVAGESLLPYADNLVRKARPRSGLAGAQVVHLAAFAARSTAPRRIRRQCQNSTPAVT